MANIQTVDSPAVKGVLNDNFDALNNQANDLQNQINQISSTGTNSLIGVFTINATQSNNNYSGTYSGLNSYFNGLKVAMRVTSANTGASTLNINNLGVKNIKIIDSLGNKIDIIENAIIGICDLEYDGVDFVLKSVSNELIESRTSSIYGDFSSVKARCDNTDDMLNKNITSDSQLFVNVTNPPLPLNKCLYDGTDESAKVQAIVNYVSSLGGGTVFFINGTLIANITPKSNVNLLGQSHAAIIMKPATGDWYKSVIESNSHSVLVENFKMSNLTIDGNKAVYPSYHTGETWYYMGGLRLVACKNVVVENCIFQNAWGNGIYIGDTHDAGFGTPNPLLTTDVTVRKNRFINLAAQGVAFIYGENILIDDNYFYRTSSDDIDTIHQCATDINIEFTHADDILRNITIQNNTLEHASVFYRNYEGLNVVKNVTGSVDNFKNITLFNNTLKECGTSIISAHDCTIEKHNIEASTPVQLYCTNPRGTGEANNLKVINCNLKKCSLVNEGFAYSEFSSNTIVGAQYYGIKWIRNSTNNSDGKYGKITNNTILDIYGVVASGYDDNFGLYVYTNQDNCIINNNIIRDTKSGASRTMQTGLFISCPSQMGTNYVSNCISYGFLTFDFSYVKLGIPYYPNLNGQVKSTPQNGDARMNGTNLEFYNGTVWKVVATL